MAPVALTSVEPPRARGRGGGPADGEAAEVELATVEEEGEAEEESLRCRSCDHVLARLRDVFAVRPHAAVTTHVNPHGFVHEVVTVRHAPGAAATEPPSTDFSWYPGHAWRLAHCRSCAAHVGWRFDPVSAAADGGGFWGLRTAALATPP